MESTKNAGNMLQRVEKARARKLVCFYVAIVALFVAIGPWIFSSNWISSSDCHSCIEITGSVLAFVAGIACLMYFFGLKSRFFLIVGLGFFVSGSEDLIHGIFSFKRLFSGTGVDLSRFVPGTYVAGRITLAIAFIVAPLVDHLAKRAENLKREAILYSSLVIALGAGLTAIAVTIDLPQFIYPDRLISRPVDFLSAILFLVAFVLVWKRFVVERDIFSGMLVASILLNLAAQIYMSFSNQLFDAFFDLAHYAKVLSYMTPMLGISMQGLEEIKKSNREVTERRRTENALASLNSNLELTVNKLSRSNRELQDFAYVASHDLREPLRAITSLGQLLEESLTGKLDADEQENLDFMIDGARRMTQMIDALLTYSRVSTKGSDFQQIDVNEILERLGDFELAARLEETHAEINIPEPLPDIKGDPTQISQLLQNLIGNALKFTAPGTVPKVVIRSDHSSDGMARIEVRDNGIGIQQEYCSMIFTMFKRLHSHQEYDGAGIGLSVCKKIVERHGGEIGVSSEPGGGSVFWFTLPVADAVEIAV
jgi:signal transduction histidine kinase